MGNFAGQRGETGPEAETIPQDQISVPTVAGYPSIAFNLGSFARCGTRPVRRNNQRALLFIGLFSRNRVPLSVRRVNQRGSINPR